MPDGCDDAFSLVGLIPLMRLLKTPESILSESYSYISVLTIFIGVMFAYNLCAWIAAGDRKQSDAVTIFDFLLYWKCAL